MQLNRRHLIKGLAAASVLPAPSLFAQTDTKKLIVGFPPGTATDGLARLLGEKMRGLYAPNFVVENKVGAGGQLAVMATKTAAPDGNTILVSPIMVLSVTPHTFAKVGYDPVADLIPVGNCVTTDFSLAVGPAVPEQVKTVAQYLDWCKANPSQASFATGVTGSKIHFSGIKLGMLAGTKLTHIGYTNGGNALTDLAGGNVPAYIGTVPTVMPFLNRIRVLATMGAKRSRFLPDVPTLVEAGYKDMVINEAISLYFPARTSEEHVKRLHAAMVQALSTPEASTTLTTLGMEPTPSTGAELANKLKGEIDQWGRFVKQIGFKQDT
jgi:tripartite-type tricarboxylate transporter receptor subunit TctC